MKLNIGCGNKYESGWVNTDITKQVKADYYFNVGTDKFPFKNNTFDEAKAEMVFEHLANYNERIHFLKELYRVCKPTAKILLTMPHFSCHGAWQDLQHTRPFGSMSFDYVSVNKTNPNSIMHDQEIEGENSMFKTTPKIVFGKVYKLLGVEWFANTWRGRQIYEFFWAYMLPCREIHFTLEVVKK